MVSDLNPFLLSMKDCFANVIVYLYTSSGHISVLVEYQIINELFLQNNICGDQQYFLCWFHLYPTIKLVNIYKYIFRIVA